jgi:SAM-dependent methyltransferase
VSEHLPPDHPLLVQWEFASEERLVKRDAVFRFLVDGVHPDDVAFDAVAEVTPQRVLDAGCGPGRFIERVRRELGANVSAIDISPRMVDLTAMRGIDAQLADVEALPFADGEFDCVVANWVLHHVPDLDRAVGELARVLRSGGRLVAGTLGRDHMAEMWRLVGGEPTHDLKFWGENGAEGLEGHFARVERRDANGVIEFPDRASIREYVAATITRAHLADRVPGDVETPFRTRSRHCVFLADKATS